MKTLCNGLARGTPCDRPRMPSPGFPADRGFTLIELAMVMVLVAVLSVVLLPVITRAAPQEDFPACAPNLRVLGVAAAQYAADHEGRLPPVGPPFHNYSMAYFLVDSPSGTVVNHARFFSEGYLADGWAPLLCPLNRNPMFPDSHGRPDHVNFASSLGRPVQAEFGYGNYRSGFIRQIWLESDERADLGPLADSFPEKAWLADVFTTPGRVLESHGDSVNVLYGTGAVTRHAADPFSPPFSRVRYGSGANSAFTAVWRELETPQ